MADPKYASRSVRVNIINDTRADLTFTGAGSTPDAGLWVDGEDPKSGRPIEQAGQAWVAAKTDDLNGTVSGTFEIRGLGNPTVHVTFFGDVNGADANATPNNRVQIIKSQVDTNEDNHAVFRLQLVPAPPPASPTKP